MLHPVFNTLWKPRRPRVRLLDLMDDVSDLTTYTFTARSVGPPRGSGHVASEAYSSGVSMPLASKKEIYAFIHSEDAATTWTVSSISIGGVNGTLRRDRGGATSAINTAIYSWTQSDLDAIANSDVAVTFSEAVTACAIGLVEVDGLSVLGANVCADDAVGTGVQNLTAANTTISTAGIGALQLIAGTIDNNAETLDFPVYGSSNEWGTYFPTLLYEQTNAEIGFFGAFAWHPGYIGGETKPYFEQRVSYSGAGAGDSAFIVVQ